MLAEGNKERQKKFNATSIYHAEGTLESSASHTLKLPCISEHECSDTFETVIRMQKRSHTLSILSGYHKNPTNFLA